MKRGPLHAAGAGAVRAAARRHYDRRHLTDALLDAHRCRERDAFG
jgi:hypothetical protein